VDTKLESKLKVEEEEDEELNLLASPSTFF
jgi:hypothetical protein